MFIDFFKLVIGYVYFEVMVKIDEYIEKHVILYQVIVGKLEKAELGSQ